MDDAIRVGLLGCGTVGGGVIELLERNRGRIEDRVGAPIHVARVLVRDSGRRRDVAIDRSIITENPAAILDDPSIAVVVEVMGGREPAGGYVERAIRAGKGVVTANKALLAACGAELLGLAREHRVDLAFEGAVAGSIPIIRTLRDHLAADRVAALRGIVNGTCNFILTRMREEGSSFADALAEAQALGFAEAEPSLDVDGHDAAHKLCVLALLAFGASVHPDDLPTEGIRTIEALDHRYAARFGYALKHLAIAREVVSVDGTLPQLDVRIHPALVPAREGLGAVDGSLNAISLHGAAVGPQLLVGRGAGALPTATSVLADLIDLSRARRAGGAGRSTLGLGATTRALVPPGSHVATWYLRMRVADRPGALGQIASALGARDVSIEQLVQEAPVRRPNGEARECRNDAPSALEDTRVVVMLTHPAPERAIRAALGDIEATRLVRDAALAVRVEE